jgi:hypothetical protein
MRGSVAASQVVMLLRAASSSFADLARGSLALGTFQACSHGKRAMRRQGWTYGCNIMRLSTILKPWATSRPEETWRSMLYWQPALAHQILSASWHRVPQRNVAACMSTTAMRQAAPGGAPCCCAAIILELSWSAPDPALAEAPVCPVGPDKPLMPVASFSMRSIAHSTADAVGRCAGSRCRHPNTSGLILLRANAALCGVRSSHMYRMLPCAE